MKWPVRKNAKAVTSGALASRLEQLRIELAEKRILISEGEQHHVAVIDDREAAGATETLLAGLHQECSILERAIQAVEAEMPLVSKREQTQAYEAKAETLRVESEKLAARVQRDYLRYAEPLCALLRELQDNEREWERLSFAAECDVGLRLIGTRAELLARPQSDADTGGILHYRSIVDYARIYDWKGLVLFEGKKA